MCACCASYLLVDICPIVDQQLQTEGTIGGDSGQVQRGVAALVWLVNVSSMVHQLSGHCLLAHVASHVERSVSKSIGFVNLTAKHNETYTIRMCKDSESFQLMRTVYSTINARTLTSAPILSRYFTISM